MFYFSTLINKPVHDKNDQNVGKIDDFAIRANKKIECPSLAGIVIRGKKRKQFFINASKIASWSNDGVTLFTDWQSAVSEIPDEKGFLFLKKSVVDHQIIDLAGVKVVRVNDLRFNFVQNIMSLLAIDVSTCGMLRRLGFLSVIGNKFFEPHFLEWKNVQIIGDRIQLNIDKDQLVQLHPADLANLVEAMNLRNGSQLLSALDPKIAAKVMEEIKPEIQKIMVQHLGLDRAVNIMDKMSTDELVDLIQLLPDKDSRRLIEEMPFLKNLQHVQAIMEFDENTAGGLMTTEFITVSIDSYVKDVIEKIKKLSDFHRSIHFIYVLDKDERFYGVVSLRRLLIASKNIKITEIAKKIKRFPAVTPDRKIIEVATLLTKYNLLSVAVVDKDGKMLGVVTVDDIMRHFMPNA